MFEVYDTLGVLGILVIIQVPIQYVFSGVLGCTLLGWGEDGTALCSSSTGVD